MKSISLQITLRSPALLAEAPPASNLLETLRFVPGNTIRGLLARRYLGMHDGTVDSVFRELFLNGETRFGFAFFQGSQVIPLSARSCKYEGGFSTEDAHGVLDLLLAGPVPLSCAIPGCGRAVDYLTGFWNPAENRCVKVTTRVITRTAIDASRDSASMGKLYLQRVLEQGQTFSCFIEYPDKLKPNVESLVAQPFSASLGRGASRGQGWVTVERNAQSVPIWRSAVERFTLYSNKWGKPVLAVTLLTDGLFRDDYLRDITAPSLADLAPLGIVPSQWNDTIARAFMDTRTIYGFDGVPIFLPRVPRTAVAAGSVFLFEAKDSVTTPTIPVGDGVGWIGDLNSEGYGRAALWHPFHLAPEGNPS